MVRKYVQAINGTGSKDIVINHDLDSADVMVQVMRSTDLANPGVRIMDRSTVVLSFGKAPTKEDGFRVIIIG